MAGSYSSDVELTGRNHSSNGTRDLSPPRSSLFLENDWPFTCAKLELGCAIVDSVGVRVCCRTCVGAAYDLANWSRDNPWDCRPHMFGRSNCCFSFVPCGYPSLVSACRSARVPPGTPFGIYQHPACFCFLFLHFLPFSSWSIKQTQISALRSAQYYPHKTKKSQSDTVMMPHHAMTRYNNVNLDIDQLRFPRRHHSHSIAVHTDRGTHRLQSRTINKYLPGLYRALNAGSFGRHHGRSSLDFTQLRRFDNDFDQRCLHRLFDYLEDLELRGGSSSLLFDRLSKTLNQSRLDYGRRDAFECFNERPSPVTMMFSTLGSYFEEHEFGHNSTIFNAMEAFFVHRSREICQFPPSEIMSFIYALDGMRGSMTSTLASLKAALGRGRRMQSLLDHCRSQFDTLTPRTLGALEQMLGERLRRCGFDRDERFFMPIRYGGCRWSNLPGFNDRDHRNSKRGGYAIDTDLVHIHAVNFRDAYSYSANEAPPGHVWALPRRMHGDIDEYRPRMRARNVPHHHHAPHHHHVRELRDDDPYDDDLFEGYDQHDRFSDGHPHHHHRRERFARSPRRRSFSSDSDDFSIERRDFGGLDYRSD